MTILNSHQAYVFVSALQLSITTKIKLVSPEDNNVLKIYFDSRPLPDDKNLAIFLKLLKGDWRGDGTCFVVHAADEIDWEQLILFLLLTRLDEKNIIKLAQTDKSVRNIAEMLGYKFASRGVESVKECSKIIFDRIKEKKMTIRELAELTGLTQVSIGNFKSGKDIKLSNLIKIMRALNMDLKIQ